MLRISNKFTEQEWHSFVEGFAEGFCFWPSDYTPNPELLRDLRSEHHYYAAGRAVGFATLIVTITGAIVLIMRAL